MSEMFERGGGGERERGEREREKERERVRYPIKAWYELSEMCERERAKFHALNFV